MRLGFRLFGLLFVLTCAMGVVSSLVYLVDEIAIL